MSNSPSSQGDNVPSPRVIPSLKKRRLVQIILILAGVLVAGWAVMWVRYRFTHSITRDAFIDSHLINVAPQVPGDVVEVYVQEQGVVKQGQALALIDPSTYQREVDLARAKLGVAEAALGKTEADLTLLIEEVPRRVRIAERKLDIAKEDEVKATDALEMTTRDVDKGVVAAAARVDATKAVMTLAEEDYQRYQDLFRDRSVSQRRYQEATRGLGTARAEVAEAQAKLGQAEAFRKQIGIADRQLKSARHAVAEAREVLALAKLGDQQIEVNRKLVAERASAVEEARKALQLAETNLSFTRLPAPCDGVIAKKWRHRGDYARAGEPIVNMYDPRLLYVTANLEETLLEGVASGNQVVLQVDAFAKPFKGRVLWIGSATDAKFSLIPRDVSSGEFTYVVQRVPIRIAFEPDERWSQLKPGLSVQVAIRHGPGDPVWAEQALKQEADIAGIREARP